MNTKYLLLAILFVSALCSMASASEIYRDDFTSLSNMSEYNNITLDAKEGTRHGQAIFGNNSWEQGISYQSTKLVNGVYEMLYDANSAYDFSGTGANSSICYANSTNGTAFDKPILGLWSFGGNTNNNIFHQNASMDVNNHFDWCYVEGDAYPYKLMIGKHTADGGGTYYFDLWHSVNLQTKAVFVKSVTSSTTVTPSTLATNGTNWFLYYQNYPSAQTRHIGYWMSNNNSFENSTWSNQGNVDTLIALHDQKHFIHSGTPSITKPNEEQYFFWDDMSGTLTSPIGVEQLMIGTNNADWRLRGVAVPNMSATSWGVIPVTSGGFDSGWVISASGIIEDQSTGNYRVYYSGTNTTVVNSYQYGGVGMYEWTNQQVTRIRNQDKIIKSTDMGVLPDSDGWSIGGTVSGNSVSDGILTIADTSDSAADYYSIATSANDTASERLNVKFRMKVVSKSGTGTGIGMIARTNSYGTSMIFETDGVWFASDTGSQSSEKITFDTTDDFHTYELECSRGNAKGYIDGNLVFTGRTYHAGSPGVTGFYFGGTTALCLANSQWDWVRYSFGDDYNGGNETTADFTSIAFTAPTGTNHFIENHTANATFDILWANGTTLQSGVSNGTEIAAAAAGNQIKYKATLTASSDNDVYYWGMLNEASGDPYIPPDPTNLQHTTSIGWVNYTWSAGSGNITNSYNILHNEVWINGSSNAYKYNNVGAGNWSNITVYAWNNSDTGTLSASSVSDQNIAPSAAYNITLPLGWSIIGWTDTTARTAHYVGGLIGSNCTYVTTRNSTTGEYVNHNMAGLEGEDNFAIERGWGYFVKTTAETLWERDI